MSGDGGPAWRDLAGDCGVSLLREDFADFFGGITRAWYWLRFEQASKSEVNGAEKEYSRVRVKRKQWVCGEA